MKICSFKNVVNSIEMEMDTYRKVESYNTTTDAMIKNLQ